MTQFLLFRLQVPSIVAVGGDADGDLLDDFEAIALEADDLLGVIGEEADFSDPEVVEDLRADAVFAEIGGEAEFCVGLDRIEALLLEPVGADFGGEPDAAALLAHVDEDTPAGRVDVAEGIVELVAAVAAPGAEDVAGQTFAVDADGDGVLPVDGSLHQGEVVLAIDERAVEVEVEFAKIGGQLNDFLADDEALLAATVVNEVADRADAEVVFLCEGLQGGEAGHGAVAIHDLADDTGGLESGEASEVDGGLGMAGALEDTAGFGLKWEYVAGLD